MSIVINGYVKYSCGNCTSSYTIESQDIVFNEDVSPASEDDEFIRYLAQVDALCELCSNGSQIKLDVWENPASVVNYSYYAVQGAKGIQCEFSIEHYFDEEPVGSHNMRTDVEPETQEEGDDENDFDEEVEFNESFASDNAGYQDLYDEDSDV